MKWKIENFKDKKGSIKFWDVERIYPTINVPEKYLEVDLTITDKCNLNCYYCIENCPNKKPIEMSFKDMDAVIKLFKSWNIDYYSRVLFYGGECTTHNLLDYLIDRVQF